MRKYLIIVLIVTITVIIGVAAIGGLKIGELKVTSITEIKQQSEELDNRIEKINEKNIKEYKSKEEDLSSKIKELKKQRENYADMILFNTEDGQGLTNLYEKYEVEYLWTKLGNYATKNELSMKLEVTKGSMGIENAYDLNFTLNGDYISIIDCISEIENDTTLAFKIEKFNLVDSSDGLVATFTVKNVTINKIDQATQSNTSSSSSTTNTTSSTSTNTTSSTSTNTTDTTTNNTIQNSVSSSNTVVNNTL